MDLLIRSLPEELVLLIRRLTYKPQNKELLNDITSFVTTKEYLLEYYYLYYYYLQDNIVSIIIINNYHYDWIINDLMGYLNEDTPTILGYSSKFYDILTRANLISCIEDIDLFMYVLLRKSDITIINTLLGIMTPTERIEFIKLNCNKE